MDKHSKYFKKLGIPPTSDLNAIKKAYRKKAMHFHPDKNSSDDAQTQFIEITEAYEILTSQKRTTPTYERVKTTAEAKAEKIKAAKKRYQKIQETEREKDALYYEKITTGWRWKVFKNAAYYTLVFTFILALDFFNTGEQKSIPEATVYSHLPMSISYENEVFKIDEARFWSGGFPPLRMNYSFFFKDLKSVSIIDEDIDFFTEKYPFNRSLRSKLFASYNSEDFYSYGSVYYAFPFLHVFLLLPFTLVIYKRPNFNFAIGRLVSIWVIFPLVLFLSFSNGRIFHLVGIL